VDEREDGDEEEDEWESEDESVGGNGDVEMQ